MVDTQGLPRQIVVQKPLGFGLDEKAVEALQQWRFKPGTKDGQPVNVRATIEINFRLLDRLPKTRGAWEVTDGSAKKAVKLKSGMTIAQVEVAARKSDITFRLLSSAAMTIGDFVLDFSEGRLANVSVQAAKR